MAVPFSLEVGVERACVASLPDHDDPTTMRGFQAMYRAAITAAAVLSLTGLAHADEMWAVDSSTDSLYIFDSETGVTLGVVGSLNPDPARYTTPVSMAVSPTNRIFVINNSPASDDGLSRLNPATGLATHIGGDVGGSISFGPGGRLFGVNSSGRLSTVNTTTGLTTSLGGPALPRLFGLDFNVRDGSFYGITSASPGSIPELLRIDPASGNVLATIPLSSTIVGSAPGSIAFERDGDLVMTENGRRLWEINIATGRMTLRATTTEAPQGLGLACRADFDGDGRLAIFDFLAFQNAFDAGDRRADFDFDGTLTLFDFLAFQNAFDAGCP